jgi:hypothetical protein
MEGGREGEIVDERERERERARERAIASERASERARARASKRGRYIVRMGLICAWIDGVMIDACIECLME